jgi:hypothetical protein
MLLCLIEGLKLRAPRSPALDQRKLRNILDELLETLVSPSA